MAAANDGCTGNLLQVSEQGDTYRIELCRPEKGNALDSKLVMDLDAAMRSCLRRGARQIAFSGRGKHFCTGFDLSSLEEETDATLLWRFVKIEEFLQKVHFSPVPTIAIAKGRCFGAGADLFAACSNRIAFADAVFSFPGPAFGLILGSTRLSAIVGRDAARQILLSGRVLSASEAHHLRLVTAIAADDQHLESLIAEGTAGALRLEAATVSALLRVTDRSDGDADFAALVRSAAVPGLVKRVSAYRRKLRETLDTSRVHQAE
jgi:enoyl-CoA hydratase/carnithine racemase